jgi:hypothetical protein
VSAVPGADQVRGLARRSEALALVAAAVLALAFHATLPGRLPEEADHAAAAAVVDREKQPGDVVLLHPWWTERARLFVPEDVPVVGFQGSDGAPLEAAPRIWVLAQPELPRARTDAFRAAFDPGRVQVGEERRFGTLRLALFRNGRHRPTLFSAAQALAQARAWVESAPGVKAVDCVPEGRGFRCPGSPARASVGWHEVRFEPRRCLALFPPGGPGRLVVEFPGAPAADRLALEAGLIWERGAYRHPHLRPVLVGVDGAAGETLAQVSIAPGAEGYHRALARALPGGPLRLWIQAEVAEHREVCADVLAQGPEAGPGAGGGP